MEKEVKKPYKDLIHEAAQQQAKNIIILIEELLKYHPSEHLNEAADQMENFINEDLQSLY